MPFPTATVIASLGISNFKNMLPLLQQINGKEVIIAGDYDGEHSKTTLITKEAHETLKSYGIDIKIVFPEPIKTLTKTDWNDVLIHQGKESIQVQLSGFITSNKADLFNINGTLKADKQLIIKEPIISEVNIKKDGSFKSEITRSQQRIKEMEMEL